MGNMITYLKWRGDLPFSAYKFNEVDNLIFSELIYLDLKNIVPERCHVQDHEASQKAMGITIKEAARYYCENREQDGAETILEAMAKTNRFQNLRLNNFAEEMEHGADGTQFAAMEIMIDENTSYLAFRGTDMSIIGWREDFRIGYKIVPAQKRAVDYLNKVIKKDRFYIIGGHSKGGNLAVYSAMMCGENQQKQILEIYSNDGPGLCKEVIDAEKYSKIENRIKKIVPESSVIGQLFEDGRQPMEIVKSDKNGILQHFAASWQVENDHFVRSSEIEKKAGFYNSLFDEWIEQVGMEEREQFVEDFFDALSSDGAVMIDEVVQGGPHSWEKILLSMKGSDKKSKMTFWQFIRLAWKKMTSVSILELMKEKTALPWFFMLGIGVFSLVFPTYSLHILGTAAVLGLVGFCFYQCVRLERKRKKDGLFQNKEIFYAIIAVIGIVCTIENRAVVIGSNLILAVFWGYRAFRQGKRAIQIRSIKGLKKGILYVIDAIMSSGLCLLSLVFSADSDSRLLIVTGSYMILVSAIEIGMCAWKKQEQNHITQRGI